MLQRKGKELLLIIKNLKPLAEIFFKASQRQYIGRNKYQIPF